MSFSREAESESDWNALNPPERATEHELKCWPVFFQAIIDGTKTFEVRWDDRGFALGDVLWLREWDRATEQYTGRESRHRVSYVLTGCGLELGYVCMALAKCAQAGG